MKQPFEELEQLHFSREQKETLIRRLTEEGQKTSRTRRFPYRAVVALVAAVSMLIGAAGAASLAGVSPVFREMFGITTPEEEVRLGAVEIEQTFPDKNGTGVSITVRQVVRDQEQLFILADFTAPAGTILPEPEQPYPLMNFGYWLDGDDEVGKKGLSWGLFEDEACTQRVTVQGLGFSSQVLEDADPTDNVIPMLIHVDTDRGFPEGSNYFQLRNIFYLDTYQGEETVHTVEGMDMELVVPISTSTPAYRFTGRNGVKLNNTTMAVVENLALSPISISMDLILEDGDAFDATLEEHGGIDAYVLLKDGGRVSLQFHKSYGILDWFYTEENRRFFRADHVYFTPDSPLELSQIKDIVFVGDNDPEKMTQNVHYNFRFYPTRFVNETYWSQVNVW